MDTLWQDVRYGLRTLGARPGFTAMAILVLAVGIGANTALFSLVNSVLLRALPVADADRLVMLYESQLERGVPRTPIAPATFLAWRAQQSAFEDIAAFAEQRFTLSGAGEPESIEGARATASLFRVLRAEPIAGRAFTAEEDRPGERVAVLSDRLAQRRFGSAASAVGQSIRLNGHAHAVVGVMPASVGLPHRGTELWVPAALDGETGMDGMSGRILSTIGRLDPGVTVEAARAELNVIAGRLIEADPAFNAGMGAAVVPLKEVVVAGFRPVLLMLWIAVGFVLLIACANIANLLLARAVARQHEIAVRLALGATRLRIVRQFLTESVMLALAGGATGLLVGLWGVDALVALSPDSIPRAHEAAIDGRVLGFAMALSLATGIGFGLAPALPGSSLDLTASFKASRSSDGPGRHRLRSSLVITETALSLILLIGAGLMLKSFLRLQAVDPGFDPEQVTTIRLELPESRYADERQVTSFHRALLARIARLPGVEAAGATNALPISGSGGVKPVRVLGSGAAQSGQAPLVQYRLVSPGYFGAMGIPLTRGRDFDRRDDGPAPGVVIVNQAMARRFWPDQDPVGQRVTLGGWDDATGEVVGVVGDVRHWSMDTAAEPEMYWDAAQDWLARGPTLRRHRRNLSIAVRATADPTTLVRAIRGEVAALDRELPLSDVKTMEERLGGSMAAARFKTLLIGIFAAVALLLAAMGLYGVMSYAVAQRTRELGIRMALGARAPAVLRLVVGQSMRLVLAGLAVGIAIALLVTRAMTGLLFEVQPADPAIYGLLSLVLVAVALAACYLPARRATRVDPNVALRCE